MSCEPYTPFNPTLVRLGRGGRPTRPRLHEPRFQSHSGSIGATPPPTASSRRSTSFNPTLVRLGHAACLNVGRLDFAFNPTLVRLGHNTRCRAPPGAGPFQSHSGSIGAGLTAAPASQPKCFQSHSGSIGAGQQGPQRPHECALLSIPLWFDWGGACLPPGGSGERAFNPTLVRLGLSTAISP